MEDRKPDEREEPPHEPGEFTRAFGGRAEPIKAEIDSSPKDETTDGDASPPRSITQLLGGKATKPSAPPPEKPEPPRPAFTNAPDPKPASSFTSAFDGLNAFTRNPADVGEYKSEREAGKPALPSVTSSQSPGSFTRLFGSGEGVLTPSGDEEPPGSHRAPGGRDSDTGLSKFLKSESAPDRSAPLRPPERGSFTEAFHPQSGPPPQESLPESKMQRGSFTQEFGPPTSWSKSEPPPTAPPYPSIPGSTLPAYNSEPSLPSNPRRSPAPPGGFTRLIDPIQSETFRPEPPPSDATLPFPRPGRLPEPSSPHLDFSRESAIQDGATVVFNNRQPAPEVAAPQGKSEYTMVVERSKLRQSAQGSGVGAPPSPAGSLGVPPSMPPQPQLAPPTPPAWAPPVHTPQWQPPQVTPPPMPQAPSVTAPQLPIAPPSLGDKLVSSLPFILALTVINFLGLLAVLIILFATRK